MEFFFEYLKYDALFCISHDDPTGRVHCTKTMEDRRLIRYAMWVFSLVFIAVLEWVSVTMPNKCGIINCRGNYDDATRCRVFKLPKNGAERTKWLAVIPPCRDLDISQAKSFFVCEKHWPDNPPMKKLRGGSTRPAIPPCIFDVLASCLPTPRPPPRPAKQEDRQLEIFMERDRIKSFSDFVADKKIQKD